VFEPRIPGPELSASRDVKQRESASPAPGEKPQPRLPTDRERLDASLKVFHAIHQAGLCAGRPVNITQQETGIVVAGLLNSADEKAGVLKRLAALRLPEWVSIELRTLAEAASQAEREQGSVVEPRTVGGASPGTAIADFRLPIQDELEKYFGEHDVPDGAADSRASSSSESSGRMMAFANEAITAAETGLADAMVLRRLAENYGGAAEDLLSSESAALLREMLADHLTLTRTSTARARGLMLPVFEEIAVSRDLAVIPRLEKQRLASWPDAYLNVFQMASRIHGNALTLLAVNLDAKASGAAGAPGTDRALVELLLALRSVEADIALASGQTVGSQPLVP